MKIILILFISIYLFKCHNIIVRGEKLQYASITPTRQIRVIRIEKSIPTSQSQLLQLVFTGFQATTVKCRVGEFLLNFELGKNHFVVNGSTILRTYAKKYMSTKWQCTLTNPFNDRTMYILNVRVKAAKEVKVTIDGKELQNFTLSDKSILDYDGSTEYLCEEGETLDVACINAYKVGTVRLWYYDGIDTKSREFKKIGAKDSVNFSLVVTADRNRSYVDCSFLSTDHQQFTYRVIFMLKNNVSLNSSYKEVKVTIDGKELQNFTLSHKSNLDYYGSTEYLCEEGETLNVKCINLYKVGTVRLRHYDGIDTKLKEIKQVEAENSTNFRLVVTSKANRSYVDCSYLSVEQQEFTYRVIFLINNTASMYKKANVIIDGKELQNFTLSDKSNMDYNGSTEYLCEEDETLHVACINPYKDGTVRLWFYDGIDAKEEAKDSVNFTLMVTTNRNRSYVDCSYLSTEQQQFTYRVIFMLKKNASMYNEVKVTIDGKELQNFTLSDNSNVDYNGSTEYLCEEGETLDVACINHYKVGTVRLWYHEVIDTKLKELKKVEAKDSVNFSFVVTADRNRSYVDCLYLSMDQQQFVYRVIFILKHNISMHSDSESGFLVIFGCVTGVVFVIFIAFGACYWRKKHLNKGKSSYETVRECHTSVSYMPCQTADNELYTTREEDSRQKDCNMAGNSKNHGSIPNDVEQECNITNDTEVKECLAKNIDTNVERDSDLIEKNQ